MLHHQRQQRGVALDLDGLCDRLLVVGQDREERVLWAGDGYVCLVGQRVCVDQQHAVFHAEHMLLADVGQRHVHDKVVVRQGLLVHHDGHIVKQHGGGERLDHFAGALGGFGEVGVAVAQLLRGGQVFIAPRAGLCLIAELLQRVGAQQARIGVCRIGEDDGVRDLRDPLVLSLVKVCLCHLQHLVGIAQICRCRAITRRTGTLWAMSRQMDLRRCCGADDISPRSAPRWGILPRSTKNAGAAGISNSAPAAAARSRSPSRGISWVSTRQSACSLKTDITTSSAARWARSPTSRRWRSAERRR